MATIPLSGTTIYFLSGVPFANDYKHTRWFDSRSQQTNYFLAKNRVHSMSQASFQRTTEGAYIRVDRNKDALWGTNYVMFRNADYNNKWFYGFVTEIEFKNPSTTFVHFQLDVFQTWFLDADFKASYVEREHRPLWNSDGSPVINTIDEGLNYGTDYHVKATDNFVPNRGYKWMVIISKTALDDNNPEVSVVGTPQPLHYYAIPFRNDDTVANVYVAKDGVTYNTGRPSQVLEALYSASQAVNDIVSIYVTDYIGIRYTVDADNPLITFPNNNNEYGVAVIQNQKTNDTFTLLKFKKVNSFEPQLETMYPDKYSALKDGITESKLLMYPYTVLELTNYKGATQSYKLEYIDSDAVSVTYRGSLGVSNKVSYTIASYNRDIEDGQGGKTALEHALIDTDPNGVSVIVDQLAAYIQGNRNSIENQKAQTTFNGIMNGLNGVIGTGVNAGFGNIAGAVQSGANTIQGMGNTMYNLQGILAKQQDISNIPPSLAKMGSNTAYDYGNGYNGIWALKKQIKPEYIRKLQSYFNMFGYKTLETKVPNFHTRRYWNFVKTQSCTILADFNNEDLQELKNIFDNGITLWHTDSVGDYSLDNEVIV